VTDPDITKTTLANGVRVVTESMPSALSVSIGFWAGIGSRDESSSLAGASHFLEHLLFKGTSTRSARDIAEAVDAVGGEMNAYTSKEHTAYYTRLPSAELSFGMELMADVLADPAFRPPEIEAEREVILEEILMSRDAPDDRVHSVLLEAMYPDHSIGREVLGEPDTVTGMGRDQISTFFEAHYTPANIVVAVAGDVEHDAVVRQLDGYLADSHQGTRPERRAPTPPRTGLTVERRETEQAHLALGWVGVHYDDPGRYALAVANQIIGGGAASRLFQEIREQRGLVYTVYSSPSSFSDGGMVTVYAGTAPEKVGEVLPLVDTVLDDFVEAGPTDKELTVAKGYLEGSMVLGLEDSGSRMSRLGSSEIIRGDVIPVAEHIAKIRAVTADDVTRIAEQVFAGPPMLAAVGPFDETEPAFERYR
jgi:predicted Zn-dependent peptidase